MALTKAIFHPLERLDIVDVDALQDLAHNAIYDVVGGVLGLEATGVLVPWLSATITGSNTIEFGDFTFVGSTSDVEGNARHKPMFFGKFSSNASGNGDCDFSSFLATTQAYYSSNSFLPPKPGDDTYDVTLHGDYYPYIYCRPVVSDGALDVRRFWSAGDNNEVTNSVNTRTVVAFEFLVVSVNEMVSAPDSGYPWTRVGRITQWTVNGGIVSLSNIHVRAWTLANSVLGNSDISNVSNGGLFNTFRWLSSKLTEIQQGGLLDNDAALAQPLADTPRYSLSGLQYEIESLTSTVEALPIPQHASVICEITWAGGTYPTLAYTTASGSDFTLTPYLDYTALRKYITALTGNVEGALTSVEWDTYVAQTPTYASLLNTLALAVPATEANRRYELSVTPLFSDSFATDQVYYEHDTSAYSYTRYRELMAEQEWHTMIASDNLPNQPGVITAYTRQTQDTATPVVFYGVKVGERGIKPTTFGDLATYDKMKFRLRISLTIYRT